MRDPRLTEFARAMRSTESTPAERVLWKHLRRRPLGHKFRRQEPIGSFIADYLSYSARLIVEIDGPVHDSGHAADLDQQRTEWLESRGFTVIRFDNADVFEDVEWVLSEIEQHLSEGGGS